MGLEQLRHKIEEQQAVYHALKEGDNSTVCYKEFQNGEWGTDDENYTNRLRLVYYLLYCHIEDEEVVAALFEEELKDRERNSFQGIGIMIHRTVQRQKIIPGCSFRLSMKLAGQPVVSIYWT